MRIRFCVVVLFSVVALACGPRGLREEDTTPRLSLGTLGSRHMQTLTDLEEVRDVLVAADGAVYLASDAGLFRHSPSGEAAGGPVQGVSDDVLALADDEGAILMATARGLVRLAGETVTRVEGAPDVGSITDLARTPDGTLWMCGLGGVARRVGQRWEIFGERVRCTTLAPTPEGRLWVGTTAGLFYVDEGDVVREHPISGGMPEGYVRAIVPVQPGKIFAILQGPNDSKLGYWDGTQWFGYTIRGARSPAVGLVRRGSEVLLVMRQQLLSIAPNASGVPLVPISQNDGTVRSYRARVAASAQAGESAGREALPPPRELAEIPENQPTFAAPVFSARVLDPLPGGAYAAFVSGNAAYVAIANGGVLRLPRDGDPSVLRTLTLVPEQNLMVASDRGGTVWMLARGGQLAKMSGGRLRRVATPAQYAVQAIASGPQGAYLIALEPSGPPNVVTVLHHDGSWRPLVARTLELPTRLRGVPFMGVAPDGKIWAALSVEEGGEQRVRGVAVIDPNDPRVVYHHRQAVREQGGLPLPDEVTEIEFDTDDNAWFASLSGLVRVGNSQAVIFGEARGVRGEVVSDVAITDGLIWLTSAEGIASYDRHRFDYGQPGFVERARPTRLATDSSGVLWAGSSRGLLLHSRNEWILVDRDDGLPANDIVDIEADASGRVWVLTAQRILLIER